MDLINLFQIFMLNHIISILYCKYTFFGLLKSNYDIFSNYFLAAIAFFNFSLKSSASFNYPFY